VSIVYVVVGDDVKRRDWMLEGMVLLVSTRRDAIGGACMWGLVVFEWPKKGRFEYS